MTGTILIAGEDAGRRKKLAEVLLSAGYRIIEAGSGYRALDLLRRRPGIALALIELEMSDIREVDFVANIRTAGIDTALIALAANEEDERLSRAIASGANDFLIYPVTPLRLTVAVSNLLQRAVLDQGVRLLRHDIDGSVSLQDFVATSQVMQDMIKAAEASVDDRDSLLVVGETGTEPELLARAIHNQSDRANAPFLHIRCTGRIDDDSSLERWMQDVQRKLAKAKGGTVFFSDIDRLDTSSQEALLSLLKHDDAQHCRLMASASASLADHVGAGDFSKDLWHKLAQTRIEMPPLRNRREDIPDLVSRILARILAQTGHARITGISGAAQALLLQHDWPNNNLELENMLYRAVLLGKGSLLSLHDFPQLVQRRDSGGQENVGEEPAIESSPAISPFFDSAGHILPLQVVEKELISEAMKRYRGRISEVARRLQIGRSTLYRKLEEYKLDS